MSNSILITGASGTIGTQLLKSLKARGVEATAMTSRPGAKVGGLPTVHGDYRNPDSLVEAFRGFDLVFLLQPLAPEMKAFGLNAVAAAKAAGVKHLVRSSGAGADAHSPFSIGKVHGEIDDAIRNSGLAWTILGPASFMQNLLTFSADSIKQGAVYAPNGNGATALIDARDIADSIAAVLADPAPHAGRTYTLTGGEALTDAAQMEILSKVLGRTIQYVDVPEAAAQEAMGAMGMPPILVDWLMSLNAVVKAGYAATTTEDVATLTGHRPRTFVDFVHEHAKAWK
jgi:uncharacterized protein YbjT (DUF2867 family)